MGEPTWKPEQDDRRSGEFWVVIPAGGSGTRLWPLSRAAQPKFLLPLLGNRSLLQQTHDRLAPLAPPERVLVVCGRAHATAVASQLADVPESNIVVEPAPKGSGPAIGLAAAIIRREDPDAIMGSFAADHRVGDEGAFLRAMEVAAVAAREGWLVTVGLTPTRPETGYGYIERTNEPVASTDQGVAYRAVRFVEKPEAERVKAFVDSGRFLWNASMFVWRAQTLLDEMRRLQPELRASLDRIATAWGSPEQGEVLLEEWSRLPASTIDEGIMARAERVAVVPAEMGWFDVGDWHGLGELMEQDALGNSVRGDLVEYETKNNTVWSETNRLVALVGVENVVVVDTRDALLVVDRSRAQDVRRIVDRLKESQRIELS